MGRAMWDFSFPVQLGGKTLSAKTLVVAAGGNLAVNILTSVFSESKNKVQR